MNRFLLILLLTISLSSNILAQNPGPNVSWQKCFSTSEEDYFNSIIKLESGDYLATMYFGAKDHFLSSDTSSENYLVKFDNNFNVIWKRYIPMYATKIIILNDKSFVLAGLTTSWLNKGKIFNDIHGLDQFSADLAILKYDSNAQNVIWAHAYGSTGAEDQLFDCIQTSDNGFIFTGKTRGSNGDIPNSRPCFNPFAQDATIMKVNSLGALQWVKMINGSLGDIPSGSIVSLSNDKYKIDIISNSDDCDFAGTQPFDLNLSNFKLLTLIINENGNEIKRKIDDTGKQFQYIVKSWQKNNRFYSVGYTLADLAYSPTFPSHDDADGSVAVYDDSLNLISQKLFGGKGYDFFFDHIYDNTGNHIFFGATASSDNSGDIKNYKGGTSDYWILKTDTNFNIIWSRTVGSNGMDSYLYYNFPYNKMLINGNELVLAFNIYPPKITPNNDVTCGLYTTHQGDTSVQYPDAWLVAFDLTTGIEIEPILKSSTFKLFPNPTSNVITIQNSNPTAKKYKIFITDQLGKIVKEIQYEDTKEFSLSIEDLDNGIYFISVQKNRKQLFSQKIVIRK